MLEAILAIAVGVIVYFLGRLFVALFVNPILSLRSLIGEIAESLVFYANVYCNPKVEQQDIIDEPSEKASEVFRRQASQLKARVHEISWYSLWERVKVVRKEREIEEASSELMGLANSVRGDPMVGANKSAKENSRKKEKVEELLGIVKDKEPNRNQ